jgi:hypothetical protein
MKSLAISPGTLDEWYRKAKRLDEGAVSAFDGSFELGRDHCSVSILKSFTEDFPWFVQVKIFPYVRDVSVPQNAENTPVHE